MGSEPEVSSTPKGMVAIPAGDFMMGLEYSNNEAHGEKPAHKVVLDAFFMDVTPVTQLDYVGLMRVNPSFFQSDAKRPVEKVTWYDAVLYCNARSKRDNLEPVYSCTAIKNAAGGGCEGLENFKANPGRNGYRLPTEAEWEYACRAGTGTEYYWGDEMCDDHAWWIKNSGDKSHPVGKKKPNAFGLYDMSGNVWEWCADWFAQDYYANSPEKNPQGPDSGEFRIHRGGSWMSLDYLLTSARRYWLKPYYRFIGLGFRCVLSRS